MPSTYPAATVGYRWVDGGAVIRYVGNAVTGPGKDAVMWCWNGDLGARVFDLLDDAGNPVTEVPVVDNTFRCQVPIDIPHPLFSVRDSPTRLPGNDWDLLEQAANKMTSDDAVMAGFVADTGSATRAAVNGVMGGDVAGLLSGGKVAPSKLPDLSGTYGTVASVLQRANAARETSATATYFTHASPTYDYELIRVRAGAMPGFVQKRFAGDYEKQGTTGLNFKPTRETLASVFARTGADIIVNGAGWTEGGANDGMVEGAQIKDGVAYHDFAAAGSARGTDALGFRADGSTKIYSSNFGDTAASMVADGVVNSFSFGPGLVNNGVKMPVTGTTISARRIVGVDAGGDLLIVTVIGQSDVFGNTLPDCADLAMELGMVNAVALDGGGSAQSMVSGMYTAPSSDTTARPVPDFLVVRARVTGPRETLWVPLALQNGFVAAATVPAVKVRDGIAWFRGACTNTTATAATLVATVPWWARPGVYHRFPATIATTIGQYYDVDTSGQLLMTATATNGGPRYLDPIRYPVGG